MENGARTRKPRPQSERELALMGNAIRLFQRSGVTDPSAQLRVLRFLEGAIATGDEQPADVDPPNQTKIPGTEDEGVL